jgi:hypothetical protein
MSEFMNQGWAVISERSTEASGLNYIAALELLKRLTAEKISGLAIVTDEAARRFNRNIAPAANLNRPTRREA